MSNQEFHGAFVFRNQGYGILSSTYFDKSDPKPYPETAVAKTNIDENNPFIGTFETTWLEKNNKIHTVLKIIEKMYYPSMYDLVWTINTKSDTPAWEGLGMLEDGLLVGCYWKALNEAD